MIKNWATRTSSICLLAIGTQGKLIFSTSFNALTVEASYRVQFSAQPKVSLKVFNFNLLNYHVEYPRSLWFTLRRPAYLTYSYS